MASALSNEYNNTADRHKNTKAMDDPAGFYQTYIDRYSGAIKKLKQQLFNVAVLRFFAFAGFALCIFAFIRTHRELFVALALLALAAFLYFVKRSSTLTSKKLLAENLFFINRNEKGMIAGLTNQFDAGETERSPNEYYEDLDIFGAGSMFQLLNRTSTTNGKAALAGLLKHSLLQSASITAQQEAIKALAPQHDARQLIVAGALANKDATNNLADLDTWLNEPPFMLTKKWLLFARFALPVLNIAALIFYLYTDVYGLLSLTVLLSWLHVGYAAKYTNMQSMVLGKKQEVLNAYAAVLSAFNTTHPGSSPLLQTLQQQTKSAYGQISRLSQLVSLLDQRLNILVNILLNSFFLYDLQCLVALEKWKAKNKVHLAKWIDSVGQIECLVSLSTYAFNHAENVYPTLAGGGLLIKGSAVYHPLIPKKSNVSNDVCLGKTNKLLLITGSNMSGKTTYLRTVGINTLMAQCGLPVCAASFHFSPVKIYSSIRISDSLQEQTSYFMAELKRLQYIKKSIESNEPSLVLIDEILRGTNSEDKYHGSEQFVEQLIKYNSLALFATHDLKLSSLQNQHPGVIENYCFESVIKNDELIFDYTILRGVAKNKNASFLMKKMEII